jgi:phytoene dehydrogenase-like protein
MNAPTDIAHGRDVTKDRPVVVGASMAGLTAAVPLHEAGVPVRVFEAPDRAGGRERTDCHGERYLLDRGCRATCVRVARRKVPAAAVVVTADPMTAGTLTKLPHLPGKDQGVPSVTVVLAGARSPGTGPRLALDATRQLLVNEIAPLSAVQPTYAPAGQHLMAAHIVGEAAHGDDLNELARRARDDVARVLGHEAQDWRILKTVAEPFAQFAQPPGIYRRLPGNVTPTPGLNLASEATIDSSYNGALASGETAAAVVRRGLLTREEPRVGHDDTR